MAVPQIGKGNMMQEKWCEMVQMRAGGIRLFGNIAQQFGSACNMQLFAATL